LSAGEIVFDPRPQCRGNPSAAPPKSGDLIKGKPLIVLINGGSASASENRRRRAAGPQAGDPARHPLVRQGPRCRTIIPLGSGKRRTAG